MNSKRELHAPFVRAPESTRSIYIVMIACCSLPLIGGWVMFGLHAITISILTIASCVIIERIYFRITHSPAVLGGSHAWLTGVILALTLPPFTPWWAAIIASAFAILLGKAAFGGVGHFIWQPALVGRVSLSVIMPLIGYSATFTPSSWPLLARNSAVVGDINNSAEMSMLQYQGWRQTPRPPGADGYLLKTPGQILFGISNMSESEAPQYSAIANIRSEIPRRKPALLERIYPMGDMIFGAHSGAIGETSALLIVLAGIYLIYRHYIKWQLPAAILISAGLVAAVAPIRLCGPNNTDEIIYLPILSEGLASGFTYVNYQLLSGGLVLCAFLIAPEMTSRPVTTGGQVLFGIGCGVIAMLLQLYLYSPAAAFIAVLIMNTAVPMIDAIWRPRVFGFSAWRK